MKNKKLELKQEREKLKSTIEMVKELIQNVNDQKENQRRETMQALKNMNYSDINQQHEIMVNAAQNEEDAHERYQQYLRALKCPYFCRIDFAEDNRGKPQPFYIGKCGLTDKSSNQIVLDWRTPIANIYYANTIGKVAYMAPEGEIKGNLSLKRHYIIKDGKLESMMDVDVSATDEFLQMALGDSKDNRLKDIVSTIQSEQNEIIRAPLSMPLVVQGVAGSGKTTIALHRIAYLIYTYQKEFSSDDFLIIAPNELFLDYISAVLPELGVDRVRQSTFINLSADIISKKYKLIDMNEKLATLLSPKVSTQEKLLLNEASHFKSSLVFLNVLEQYVNELTENNVPELDFVLNGYVLYTSDQIRNEIYLKSDAGWTERLKSLRQRLNSCVKKMRNKIEEDIRNPYDEEIEEIREHMPTGEERRLRITNLINQRNQAIEEFKHECKTAVSTYMKCFPKIDIIKSYRELLVDSEKLCNLSNNSLPRNVSEYISVKSRVMSKKNEIEIEDLAPLIYLEMKLNGINDKVRARFVAIDEAQDFSELQLAVLKQVFKTEKFSIFGDISQGIHGYRGINNWENICKNVFQGHCEYRILEQSYRTTIEIMDFANQVISCIQDEALVKAKPVVRHGIRPQCISLSSETQLFNKITQKVNEYIETGYSSIAIITKTDVDARKVRDKMIRSFPDLRLLKENDVSYAGGIMVLPAHLSKGLEFDAVIVTSLDDDYTNNNLDIKLLYVAITRALHRMDIIHLSGNMQLLKNCN